MKTDALFSYCFLESFQHVRFLIFLRKRKLSSLRHWELNGPLLSKLKNRNGGTGRLSKNLRFVTIPLCYGKTRQFCQLSNVEYAVKCGPTLDHIVDLFSQLMFYFIFIFDYFMPLLGKERLCPCSPVSQAEKL